jgi:hypothetical protein
MGISACFVTLLLASLGSLFDFAAGVSKPLIAHGERLTVHISKSKDEHADQSLPQDEIVAVEPTKPQQDVAPVESPEPPAESQPAREWHALAEEAVKASMDEYFRQEETRASMWRRTHSIMFQPVGDMPGKETDLASLASRYWESRSSNAR